MESNLHHAYLVIASREEGEKRILSFLKSIGIEKENNPDLHFYRGFNFSIEEARALTERSAMRAFGKNQVFIIVSEKVHWTAQNALLKTLEDPTPDTIFFIVSPQEDVLLPTLRSRMQILTKEKANLKSFIPILSRDSDDLQIFLAGSIKERIKFAGNFSESGVQLGVFLDGILRELKEKGAGMEVLKKVFNIRMYADDSTALSRLILEHIALIV